MLETPIRLDEIKNALKKLNQDSSPGCDGLSPPFYLTFGNKSNNLSYVVLGNQ